jgi:hypothetical protein
MDCLEDFREVRRELVLSKATHQGYRRSRIREFISNPRLSTFQQLSPTATAFHAAPRAPAVLKRPSPLAHTTDDIPNMTRVATNNSATSFQSGGQSYQRVTMSLINGTPVLDVRFSELDVPGIIGGKSRSRPHSEVVMGSRVRFYQHPHSSQKQMRRSRTPSLLSFLDLASDSGSEGHLPGSPFFNPYAKEPEHHLRTSSSDQEGCMSPFAAVRELTPQFPVVPPRPFIPPSQFTVRQGNRDFSNRGSPAISENLDNDSIIGNSSHIILLPSKHQSPVSTPTDINMLSKYLRSDPAPTDPVHGNARSEQRAASPGGDYSAERQVRGREEEQ